MVWGWLRLEQQEKGQHACSGDVGLVRPTHQAAMQNAPPQDSVLSVKVP